MVSESYAQDKDTPNYTCSGFKVARSQREGKWAFVELSGIIAITCRHIMFRAGAVVDMITGERYHFTDAALAGALRLTQQLLEWGFTYDVICIYIKSLLERFRDNFPELLPIVKQLQCCVPSFHVNAHRDLCQIVYGLQYAQGFGHICGEWVETPWSENNIAGLVTREMTGGGRHDALNDLFNFWNRVKLERLVDTLVKQLEKAYEAQEKTTEQFANLVGFAGAKTSAEWAAMDTDTTAPTPVNHVAKEEAYAKSVYVLDRSDMPTREKALSELIRAHESGPKPALESAVAHLRKGTAHFVKAGIELDLEQFTLRERTQVAESPGSDLQATLQSFHERFTEWRVEQKKYMALLPLPEEDNLTGAIDDESDDTSELLALPSDFNATELDAYNLRMLASYELKLRIGLAFDLLEEVREAVKHSAAHLDEKTREAHGKKEHTREQTKINKSRDLSKREARRYNHNFARIATLHQHLGQTAAQGKMESNLRAIDLDKDLKMVNLTAGRSRGDTQLLANASWIWSVFLPAKVKRIQPDRTGKAKEVSDSEDAVSWATQVDCAHWHRARMAKSQADAFVNYTCADFRHASAGFACLSKCWTTAATREGLSCGAQAYAYQQAAMYARMRDDCQTTYANTLKPGAEGEALDHSLSLRGHLAECVIDIAPYEDMMKILHMN